MALIGKIRDNSILLIVVVGIAMLAFILSGWDSMFGGSGEVMGLGTVYGEMVDDKKYNDLVNTVVAQQEQMAMQQGKEYTEQEKEAAEEQVWNQFIETTILEKEYEALGIDCSENEFDAYLYGRNGFTLIPQIAQNFADSMTGQFNPRLLDKFIEEKENASDPVAAKEWEDNKKQTKEARKAEKYFQILSQGAYVTKLEAKREYKAQKELKSISYVMKRYSEIPDDQIKITDEMVKAYYEEHKNEKKYEAKAGRDVKFFDILIQANAKDSNAFNKLFKQTKIDFQNAKDDSVFAIQNSENPNLKFMKAFMPYRSETDPNAKKENGTIYPQYMDTVFKQASVGQVVGPYSYMGKMYLAKVKGFNTQLLSARHILLQANKADTLNAKKVGKMADSLVKLITKENFEEYVTKFSQDGGSNQKGGKYEDFLYDEFVPEFSKFVSNGKIDQIGVVQTNYGFHIIQVLGKKDTKAPILSVIEKTLKPSPDTEMEISSKAHNLLYRFDAKISKQSTPKAKIELFDSLAQKEGYFSRPIRVLDEKPKVNGMTTKFAEGKILSLMYTEEAEVGMLCSAPIKDQNRYVIAMISSIREKGVPNFEDVEDQMRYEVIKEKKAKRFINQMYGVKSLTALASKLNTQVMKAEVNFANPQIQGAGFEPEVVGSLFSKLLKDGKMTIPMKGEQGVYVVQIVRTIDAPKAANYDLERDQMLSNIRSQMMNATKAAFLKLAEVQDNRKFLEYGIIRE